MSQSSLLPLEPDSPIRRSLRGESIRSLRELLQASLSASSLPVYDEKKIETAKEVVDAPEKVDAPEEVDPAEKLDTSEKVAAASLHATHVRSKLLQNLGITKPPASSIVPSNPAAASSSEPWGPDYELPLNDHDKDDDADENPRKRRLQFDSTVVVHPIPSHKVYSDRIRNTIWTGAYELQENVARNSLEFSFEHWNPDEVLDEENGLIYHHQEWIHPVHYGYKPPPAKTPDEIWKENCDRLGIKPAEYYHSLPIVNKRQTSVR